MADFGEIFQKAREGKHLTFDDVTRDLKIKKQFIEAIEDEDFSIFPTMPMARGFVRNYAAYLGLNPVDMLAQFEQGNFERQGNRRNSRKDLASLSLPMIAPKPIITPDTIVTFLLITGLLGSILYFVYTQYVSAPDEDATVNTVTAPLPDNGLGESPAILLPTPTVQVTDTPIPTMTPVYYTGVTVELVIHERTWSQIIVDDVKVFDGFLEVGEERRWDGEQKVAVRVGNAGGVEIAVNGDNRGFMGERGQVIDQLWEKVNQPEDSESNGAEVTATPSS
ncbi:MAG: RodZ domain-containing protein [Chloroflexota bacterium]